MLGLLCKLLGPSKARLKRYLEEAEQLLVQSPDGNTMEEEEAITIKLSYPLSYVLYFQAVLL